jgi:hypothetical protein
MASKTSKRTNGVPTKGHTIKVHGQITEKSKTKKNAKPKPMTKAQLEAIIVELQGQYT